MSFERSSAENELAALAKEFRAWADHSDEAAWERFTASASHLIRASVRKSARSWSRLHPELVEDFVQETYLRLCLNDRSAIRSMHGRSDLEIAAYLRVVAHNVVQDYFRARMAAKRGGGLAEVELDGLEPDANSAGRIEHRLLMAKVRQCLGNATNSKRDHAIFWLYFRDGLSAKAIAEIAIIGLSSKGVESAILRLVKAVRTCMKGTGQRNPSIQKGVTD
jgi:RNA polymerase sigma-70 factor, ECF subfamily